MPYFSFSIDDTKNTELQKFNQEIYRIKKNQKYYSKNTLLWKLLNKKRFHQSINFINYEKRKKIKKLGKNILFFLPPSIGLGDAVEYALSIKAVCRSKKFNNIGIAFVESYGKIFNKYFNLENFFQYTISEHSLKSYDTIFHITLEIPGFTHQKYNRQDIEDLITSFFSVPKYRNLPSVKNFYKKKISLFPISQSPIRTMTINLLNHIIKTFCNKYEIEIILDRNSEISNYIEKNLYNKKIRILSPNNINELLFIIENISYGIFIDSGPLHVAKILNKKGILITSTVSGKILLNQFSSILILENNYKSFYCKSPCGLTNVFNFKNDIGCYDSLKINRKKLFKNIKINELQRGNLKNKYVNFISNPVNCIKNINNLEVTNKIRNHLAN